MKIQLSKIYRNTSGVKLNPGVYTDNDIGDLAAYLVDNGHATVVESDDPEPDTDSLPAYTSLTKDEWVAYADERGLVVDASKSKQAVYDDIVEALKA